MKNIMVPYNIKPILATKFHIAERLHSKRENIKGYLPFVPKWLQ